MSEFIQVCRPDHFIWFCLGKIQDNSCDDLAYINCTPKHNKDPGKLIKQLVVSDYC